MMDTAEARELARSDLCVGCAGERGSNINESLWCRACRKVWQETGYGPDLLRGGEALRVDD